MPANILPPARPCSLVGKGLSRYLPGRMNGPKVRQRSLPSKHPNDFTPSSQKERQGQKELWKPWQSSSIQVRHVLLCRLGTCQGYPSNPDMSMFSPTCVFISFSLEIPFRFPPPLPTGCWVIFSPSKVVYLTWYITQVPILDRLRVNCK